MPKASIIATLQGKNWFAGRRPDYDFGSGPRKVEVTFNPEGSRLFVAESRGVLLGDERAEISIWDMAAVISKTAHPQSAPLFSQWFIMPAQKTDESIKRLQFNEKEFGFMRDLLSLDDEE